MKELPVVTKQELLDAVRNGVSDAMWQTITNATSMPCHDFFDTVKQGFAEGMESAAGKIGALKQSD